MVQVHTCVSVHCDQCGDSLGSPGFEAHFGTERAAVDAAAEQGWLVGPGGRWYCSACGPVLTCEADGHVFTSWRARGVLLCGDELRDVEPTGQAEWPAEGLVLRREYRYCERCCLHEGRWFHPLTGSHPLTAGLPGCGKGAPVVAAAALAGSVVGEVA